MSLQKRGPRRVDLHARPKDLKRGVLESIEHRVGSRLPIFQMRSGPHTRQIYKNYAVHFAFINSTIKYGNGCGYSDYIGCHIMM
jgi:hypothetical protein